MPVLVTAAEGWRTPSRQRDGDALVSPKQSDPFYRIGSASSRGYAGSESISTQAVMMNETTHMQRNQEALVLKRYLLKKLDVLRNLKVTQVKGGVDEFELNTEPDCLALLDTELQQVPFPLQSF